MFNVPAFRAYVKTLIGEMTQTEYAAQRGITPEHLSRMMRSEKPSRPSKSTLKKLAGSSEGAYKELADLCGYNDARERVVLETKEDMVRARMEELRDSFQKMTKGARVYDSLELFLEEYAMLYDSKGAAFKIGIRKEYDEGDHFGAEYAVPVVAKYSFQGCECRIFSALYFSETRGGRVVVLDSALDVNSLIRAGVKIPEDKAEDAMKLPFLYSIRRDYAAEERLLAAIFGSSTDEKITVSEIGFGAAFKESSLTDGAVKAFLEEYGAGKYGIEEADRILAGEPASEVLKNYDTGLDIGEGAGCLLAEVVREETGIGFAYYQDVTGRQDAVSAIMVPRNLYGDYDDDDLKGAGNSLARALGIPEYGECVVYVHDFIEKNRRFKTEEE